ncbi:unnamed protein product, partial [Owenia fusiformis]
MMPQGTISVATLFILVIKVYEGYATYYVPPRQTCAYWGSWADVPGQCNPPPTCNPISKREIEHAVTKRSSPVRCTMTNYQCKVTRTCQRCGYQKRSGGSSCSRVEYKTVNRLCCKPIPTTPPPPPRPTCKWKPWGTWVKGTCMKQGQPQPNHRCPTPLHLQGKYKCYRTRRCYCDGRGYSESKYCSGPSKEYEYKPCCLPPPCKWKPWGTWIKGSCVKLG